MQNPLPAYEVIGAAAAPWLVVSHGMGLDALNMRPLAERLSQDWRVLLWDMPGHGDSAPLARVGMESYADALEAVIASAGAEAPVLLGFSFGGMVSQYLAAREPRRHRALIAYGCFAPFHQPAPYGKLEIAAALTAYRLQSWARIREHFSQACALTQRGRAEIDRATARCSKPVFTAMARALLSSFKPRAMRFNGYMLILRGADDSNRALLETAAAGLKAAHPHAKEVIIANAGHCAHDDRFEETAAAIEAFLKPLGEASRQSAG